MINNMEIPIFAILVKKKKTKTKTKTKFIECLLCCRQCATVLVEVFLESLSSLLPCFHLLLPLCFPNQTSVLADSV